MVGLQGDVGIFSFYATKLMTSGGQGGMFVSKNQEYVDAVRDYRELSTLEMIPKDNDSILK